MLRQNSSQEFKEGIGIGVLVFPLIFFWNLDPRILHDIDFRRDDAVWNIQRHHV